MSQAAQANNVLYAQAGGVTAVINASAAAVIETVQQNSHVFGKIYAAINGIKGVLEEDLVDLSEIDNALIEQLKYQPGAAFKACRFDLDPLEHNPAQYERVLAVFKAYQIGYFFYNGGNGSMVTAQKVSDYCRARGHQVICVGVAKTIDNDIALSHCSPGFGSAVKYLATSFIEATIDIRSMHETSTKFFVMEAMGRNAGWLSLAAGLVKQIVPDAPLLLLPAETPFNRDAFLQRLSDLVEQYGYCVCMVSEGLQNENGDYLNITAIEHTVEQDYTQLGGVGEIIAKIAADHLNCKTHCAIPDYLQRSASHCVSQTDWEMAYGAGKASVMAALRGEHGTLPVVIKTSDTPFAWDFQTVNLQEVANLELRVPDEFICCNGMDISQAGIDYLLPLVQGERSSPFVNGLPAITPINFQLTERVLPKYIAFK
ncbi:pyrophosphate--fructose 6-phosphate 1-phosphotransferase [Thiosulfatimonas sediminis]|uniref:Pyrophosphate--fructose 6-phosphate 1-phosphotransferase n=1 Tax=Thiosulfatimonas sediminis TaxID=2675054 RepID=A0A6F8PU69_9GAMM|nr:6-phosphofructokinase [Thiosulfatimonas sediminis]BBP45646.1 pyrophosphate--fructose 6-phosphate 1-phosphotransferase [Thiosulfatimonas sediminis]